MQDNSATRVVTPPTGWTLLGGTGNDDSEWTNAWMYRLAPASAPTSYTWTWTSNSFNQGSYLFELSGVDTTTPIDVSKANQTYEADFDTSWTESALTIVTAGAWDIVSVCAKDNSPYALTSPAATYTERIDVGGIGAIYIHELGTLTAGASTGVRSGTNPGYDKITYSFAVRPSGGGGGGTFRTSTLTLLGAGRGSYTA
jgi:hypothetical protein